LKSETQVLADNGNWEQLSYNGETAHYWTPRNVAPDWSPFTVGQWTNWSGEQLWVPYERFGWVTHHHGGWIFLNNHWYWRPPVAGRWRYVPWYPARVAWVHSGRHIGWVPISPYEVYYGRRYWGPRSVIYNEHMRNVDFRRYVNINRVVVVDKERLYGVHRRYETIRDVTVVKNIVNNGRAAPVVTREVVKGADLKMEHQFARSGDFSRKPNVDGAAEFAGRRRGAGGTENAQALAPGIQKANLKTTEAKLGDENKRNLPDTPRELRREQRQEKRLEANKERSTKEASGPQQLQHQQRQQQVAERQQQQQQPHQDAQQQRRQQQFERQQQQQLGQEQQRALRQQQQAQRQQQLQAQQQQQQLVHQQQAAQRQQQLQAQQQQQQVQRQQQPQGQPRQNQKQAHRQQQQ
jgi:DNA segregation ATPase FtsK/SpoIIIE-like protein